MRIVINPKYQQLENFLKSLPDTFSQLGEPIHTSRNNIRRIETHGLILGVKSYRTPIFINRFVYTYLREPKARRAYEYALQLLQKGINTPEPVAYIEERKNGLLNRSYYIYIYEDQVSHIREEMLGNTGDKDFEKQLALFIADIHNKGVLPLDMSPGNILWKPGENNKPVFSLIDFNRMVFMDPIPTKLRYKSFKRISEDKEIIEHLAREYAYICNLDAQEAAREIYKYCYQFSDMMKKNNLPKPQ